MKRFARIAVPLGAALVALVLAIAASATTSKADKTDEGPDGGSAPGGHELPRVHPREGRQGQPEAVEGLRRLGQPAGWPGRDRWSRDGRRVDGRGLHQPVSRWDRRPSAPARAVLHQVGRGGRHDLRAEVRQRQADQRGRGGCSRHGSPVDARHDRLHQADHHRRRHHSRQRCIEDRCRPLRRRPAHPPAVRQLREERPPCEDGRGRLSELPGRRGVGPGDREGPEGCRHRHQAGRLHAGTDRPDRTAARGRGRRRRTSSPPTARRPTARTRRRR